MPLNFTLVATNPNDTTGGGGTVASEVKDADVFGPYFVWSATEMESYISPHVVVSAAEVLAMYEQLKSEVVAGGESSEPVEHVEQVTGSGEQPESKRYILENIEERDAYSRALRDSAVSVAE